MNALRQLLLLFAYILGLANVPKFKCEKGYRWADGKCREVFTTNGTNVPFGEGSSNEAESPCPWGYKPHPSSGGCIEIFDIYCKLSNRKKEENLCPEGTWRDKNGTCKNIVVTESEIGSPFGCPDGYKIEAPWLCKLTHYEDILDPTCPPGCWRHSRGCKPKYYGCQMQVDDIDVCPKGYIWDEEEVICRIPTSTAILVYPKYYPCPRGCTKDESDSTCKYVLNPITTPEPRTEPRVPTTRKTTPKYWNDDR